MTNETTASQPKSIGDDAQFWAELSLVRLSKSAHEQIKRAENFLVPYLDSFFRAQAAQASATIQAAPVGWRDKLRWSKANPDMHGYIAFTPAQLEHFVSMLCTPDVTIQEPVMVAEPVGDELHFNAQRLRNVALLVGLTGAIPDDDATLDGARGAVLGMIAGRLRGEAKIDALAAPMVADPAGVAAVIGCGNPESAFVEFCEVNGYPSDGEMDAALRVSFYGGIKFCMDQPRSAATVKAVPSEALAALKRYPDSAGPGRSEMFRVVDVEALFAAPLADKTEGAA